MKILVAIDYSLNGKRLDENEPATKSWLQYVSDIQKIAGSLEGCEALGLGCWLLTREIHAPLLETVLRRPGGLMFPYRICVLPSGDDWVCKIVPKSA